MEYGNRASSRKIITHKVERQLFIDFTGKRLQIVDTPTATGEVQDVEVFSYPGL
jgi:hypothetical protein